MTTQLDLFMASAMEEEPKQPQITEEQMQRKHDKKYKQKLLTPEEWSLYRLIKYNSEVLKRKTTQREIANALGLKYNEDIKCHDACPSVWTMVSHINLSFEIEKIIITHEFEYWFGGELETQVFLDKLWQDILPRLTRYWTYLRKIKKDGQGKLLSAQLQPIDEDSQAREFVESYLRGE